MTIFTTCTIQELLHPKDVVKKVKLILGPEEYVGHGVFGNVYKSVVEYPPPHRVVAVKKIWPQVGCHWFLSLLISSREVPSGSFS